MKSSIKKVTVKQYPEHYSLNNVKYKVRSPRYIPCLVHLGNNNKK